MKTLRTVHLYLGCAFAPLLLFFIVTGFAQTFEWHEGRKDGSYQPPRWIASAASIHTHQRLPVVDRSNAPSRVPLRIVAAGLCVGLLATTSLGLAMAWRMAKQRARVLLALAAGVAIPVLVAIVQHR